MASIPSLGMAGVVSPVYQPILDLHSGQPFYFEALARATTKKNHVRLLEFAEAYGFIHLLDIAMIDLAAQALEADPQLRIGVNVSVATIEQCTGPLVGALYNYLPLIGRFVIEITETVPIRDVARVRTFVSAMKAAGVLLAFDDFGRGCFTYEHIREFRPNVIKLADTFFTERRERAGEIGKLLAIAREQHIRVVAEAIDTEEKRRACLELGIRYAQGFLVGGLCQQPDVVPSANVVDYRLIRAGGREVAVPRDTAQLNAS